jgi:hypothetical protein
MINIWSRYRENFKFYLNSPVPLELEQKLDAIVYACPMQTHNGPKVQIFKAGFSDKSTKELLSRYRFKNNDTEKNEAAPMTAPLVYFCCQAKDHDDKDQTHAGIIGGAMMAETLNAGYDFSFIGCTESTTQEQEDLINEHLQAVYGINHRVWAPFLAFCVGIGQKKDGLQTYYFEDGTTAPYEAKIHKPQKPKILYKASLSA